MALFVFDPTVLTNAPFVTTDMGAASGFFASVYLFYRFVKCVTWPRAVACGVVVALTLASKHSAVLLLPVLVLLACGEAAGRWFAVRQADRDAWFVYVRRMAAGMVGVVALSVFVLWAVYSFRFAIVPHGVAMPPLSNRTATRIGPVLRSIVLFCNTHHLLPKSYLYGLVDVERVGLGMPSYVFG
jgi:hypothetical protein